MTDDKKDDWKNVCIYEIYIYISSGVIWCLEFQKGIFQQYLPAAAVK